MNRGSALKWIECLNKTTHMYDNSQLGFVSEYGTYMSPIGILCEFLSQGDPIIVQGNLTWDNEMFCVPTGLMKRAKIKTPWLDHEIDGEIKSLYDALDSDLNRNDYFGAAANYIEENYALF